MYRQTITLTPDKPNFPLIPLWVGQGSAAIAILSGIPDAVTACVVLTPMGGGTKLLFPASLNDTTGLMEVYIPGWAFPLVGDTRYAVEFTVGTEDTAKTFWAGKGDLHIWEAETVADIPNAPFIPHDTYLYNETTQLYYKLTVEQDPVTGLFMSAVAQEGVANVP